MTSSFNKLVVNDSKFKLQQPKSKPVFQHVLGDAEVDKSMKQPEYIKNCLDNCARVISS